MKSKFFPSAVNHLLVRWFGCGNVPIAPGTAGSVGALPLCWVALTQMDFIPRLVFAVGFTAIAILASAQEQAFSEKRDPGHIVIDEVAGMLWSFLFTPVTPLAFLASFAMFRVFDVVKPFPASLFDRRSKTATTSLSQGAYIVLDDVVAGIVSTLIMVGLVKYVGFSQA